MSPECKGTHKNQHTQVSKEKSYSGHTLLEIFF